MTRPTGAVTPVGLRQPPENSRKASNTMIVPSASGDSAQPEQPHDSWATPPPLTQASYAVDAEAERLEAAQAAQHLLEILRQQFPGATTAQLADHAGRLVRAAAAGEGR